MSQSDDYELAKLRLEAARDEYRVAKGKLAYHLARVHRQQENFIGGNDPDAPKTERARWKELRDIVHLGNYDLRALVAFADGELPGLVEDDGQEVRVEYLHVVDPVTLGRIRVALGREKITAGQADTLKERALDEFWFPEWCDGEVKLIAVPPDKEQGPTREQIQSACEHLAEFGEVSVERLEEAEAEESKGLGTDLSLLGRWLKSKDRSHKAPKDDPSQLKLECVSPEDFEEK